MVPQSRSLSPATMLACAPSFADGATASSRSRNTRSASLAAALAIILVLVAGVDSSERRSLWGRVIGIPRGVVARRSGCGWSSETVWWTGAQASVSRIVRSTDGTQPK